MPIQEGLLAENIRRAAGAHLISLEQFGNYVGLSRQGFMNAVARDASVRSKPSTPTVSKIADAFNVSIQDLYSDPVDCLQAVVNGFEDAPVREAVDLPDDHFPPPIQTLRRASPRRLTVVQSGKSPLESAGYKSKTTKAKTSGAKTKPRTKGAK